MTLSTAAEQFNWLLAAFSRDTPDVLFAVSVSADGILMSYSEGIERASAEQLAAIVSGLTSLAHGADRCFNGQGVEQIIVEFGGGYLFVSALGAAASLGVLADKHCDMGLVAYEMAMLANRAGSSLTPAVVAELRNAVLV